MEFLSTSRKCSGNKKLKVKFHKCCLHVFFPYASWVVGQLCYCAVRLSESPVFRLNVSLGSNSFLLWLSCFGFLCVFQIYLHSASQPWEKRRQRWEIKCRLTNINTHTRTHTGERVTTHCSSTITPWGEKESCQAYWNGEGWRRRKRRMTEKMRRR